MEMVEEKIITTSAQETEGFAADFAKKLKLGDVLCLYGNLGAGKTTFVKGLANGLKIEGRIISPTFVIIREHGNFKHVDLYRIDDIKGVGLEEMIDNPKNITVIEWSERLGKKIPKKRIDIKINPLKEENSREILIKRYE